MEAKPFYAGGLKFSCTRCSACCRYEPGYVFLSENDTALLAGELKMGYDKFVETYCRWIPSEAGRERLSLKEKSGYDCIFWGDGCSVYGARPLQCRTFPFWASVLSSPVVWEETAAACPGMNRGALRERRFIEECLADRRREPVISRAAGERGA
jgi:Fe-S-cluster containining protein